MELQRMFYPKSVAVFGSAAPGKLANILINRLLAGGMEKIYAINPKKQPVGNVPAFASVLDIPEDIDMAVIASPAVTVKDVMEECGQKGIKAAVIISSGFSEAGNAEAEHEVMKVAKKYGIRSIGPNCAGLVNTHANLVATLETMPPKGNISIISQSGAIGGSFMALSEEDGVGIAKFLSYGNGADLTVIELLNYLKDDVDTKVIALYLESVTDGRKFMETVNEVSKTKPVVVVKSGRTDSGQRATMSHTGSMAGSDKVFDAALKQCGAIRANTLQELFDICKGFSMLPEIKGNNLAIITNSGGPGVMSTDKADELKMAVSEPSENIKEKLHSILPSYAGVRNPVDLTVEGTGEQYGASIEIMLNDFDAALVLYVGTPYLKCLPVAENIVKAYKNSKKPVVAVMQVGSDIVDSIQLLKENNVPCFPSGERAVYVLSIMKDYYKYREEASNEPCFEEVENKGKLFVERKRYLEPEAMGLLKEFDIPVPSIVFSDDLDNSINDYKNLGYPMVMKVVSPDIIHKSDCGGVVLNISNEAEIRQAFQQIKKSAEGKEFRGAMAYKMLNGGKEVIIGLTEDAQFGPVVAFGMGGIYTEILKDITFRVAPVTKEVALSMIKEIKMYPILAGVRGQKASDINALADAISKFSKLPFIFDDIKEADLNPVFVFEEGITVVDVRILGGE